MCQNKIIIARDFSETPGGRYIKDGAFSGEEFRESILKPAFDKLGKNEKLFIDLDGGYGYGISFLEEAFGGLAREKTISVVEDSLVFKSDDEPELIPLIQRYIKNANI